jgi:hypothetical protein
MHTRMYTTCGIQDAYTAKRRFTEAPKHTGTQRDALPRRRNTQAHKETLYRGAEIQSPAAAVGQESEEIALKKLAHIAHAHVVALG